MTDALPTMSISPDDEEEEEDEDEDKNEDEDDGKEPWTIGQGEMVNTLADNVDTMVDNQPTVLSEQRQEMCKHTAGQNLGRPPRSDSARSLAQDHELR